MDSSRRRILIALAAVASLLALPAAASAADRNDDGIPDRWERRHGLSLSKDQSRRDQDRDQLRNLYEFQARMDPRDGDSDDDGLEDGDEGAGTIESFDTATGRLRIDLFGGDSISGLVTEKTWIECDREDEPLKEPKPEPDPPKEPEREDELVPDVDEVDKPEQDEEDDGKSCSAEDLEPGAVVQEAQLYISGGSAIWKEIELRK